jgi:type I restriction enzyme, S subunit
MSNNNTTYKDSPLGKIPSDWEVKELGKMTTFLTNGFVGKSKEHYVESDEGVIYIQGYNVTETGYNFKGIKKVSKAFNEKNKKSCLKEGDLLTIQTGDIGVTTIVPKELIGANCHALIISRFRMDLAYPYFFLHYFNSEIGRRLLKTIETGSTMKHLNVGDMIYLKLPVPPIHEQKSIATILSIWNKTITTTQKLITQKEQQKKWLMQMLLTGKKRLEGFDGEWKEVNLDKIFTQINNINDGGDSHSIMTISSKLGLISQEDKFDRVIAGESLKKYTQLKKGDFAYNKGNSKTYPMGCIYQLEEYQSALVPFVYICFSPTDLIDSKFYKYWFSAYGLDRQLKKIITSGARGDGLLNVNNDDFFNLKTKYPPKKEQTAIAQVLQATDKEIQLLKSKAEKLKEQKKGLMQVLLTGKKRLKN